MELRELRYFVTVAETRHFGRAAERLHIAQSPLSQAIRRLETHLGVTLFDRTTRRVDLTPAGEALMGEAARILSSVDAARARVEQVAAGGAGTLRCAATGLATFSQVPRLLRLAGERLPGLELTFRTDMLTPAQEAALVADRIDVGVLRPPVVSGELAHRLLARERLVAALASDHRLAGGDRVALRELAGEDFVVYAAPGSVVGTAAARACRSAGFTPREARSADQTSVVLAMVAAGAGIALLPSSVTALRVDGVAYLSLDEPDGGTVVDLALAWRRDDPSPALHRFLEAVA